MSTSTTLTIFDATSTQLSAVANYYREAERIAAGSAWLDERRPDWWQRTDLDRLDVGSDCDCPLGQELGDFELAPLLLAEAAALGFYAERDLWPFGRPTHSQVEVDAEYTALTAAWREAILARRAGDSR